MSKELEPPESVASKIIKAGYRHLAMRNHPDHGGSHNAFLALQQGHEWLNKLVDENGSRNSSQYQYRTHTWKDDDAWWSRQEQTRARAEEQARERARERERQEEARQQEEARARTKWEREDARRSERGSTTTRFFDAACVNAKKTMICVRIGRKAFWIPKTYVHDLSQVKQPGDVGILIVDNKFADTMEI